MGATRALGADECVLGARCWPGRRGSGIVESRHRRPSAGSRRRSSNIPRCDFCPTSTIPIVYPSSRTLMNVETKIATAKEKKDTADQAFKAGKILDGTPRHTAEDHLCSAFLICAAPQP